MGRIRWLVAGWAVLCASAVAQPPATPLQRDPGQQLAAELAILAGDVRRLRHEKNGPQETLGLEQRLLGGIASLPLTLRRAGADPRVVDALRQAIERRDWPALTARLDGLKRHHPFDAGPFFPAPATAAMRASGERLHREVCAACHDNPSPHDTLLPAKNLARQMRGMPREEFAARLLLGVRGTPATAYYNPFSLPELAALTAFYAAAP